MKIIGISGSLRVGSLNTRLLQAAQQEVAEGATLELASFADIPLYNEDIDGDVKPDAVTALKEIVASADGLLIATPEYNYGIPGGLKNALDWLSRPAFKSVLAHKPVAIMSSSKAPTGGVRAQGQLKLILSGVLAEVYPAPEFMLAQAHQAFADSGRLIDEDAQARLKRFMSDYCAWLEKR